MKEYFYLIHFQYLGFRFHGWQKQPGFKTVHFMIDKTAAFILKDQPYKTLGCSRTDAKVSANHSVFELFVESPLDPDWLVDEFNVNLPNDIRVLKVEEVEKNFNIIQSPKVKEYQYLFTYGEKPHPFSAAIMNHFKGDLDIELMQAGAAIFAGSHHFGNYCAKPTEKTRFVREVLQSNIAENNLYTASFFPEKSFIFNIHAKGFMRYQVRLMMAQLVRLGRHEITLDDIRESLDETKPNLVTEIAPGSGLILNKIAFYTPS